MFLNFLGVPSFLLLVFSIFFSKDGFKYTLQRHSFSFDHYLPLPYFFRRKVVFSTTIPTLRALFAFFICTLSTGDSRPEAHST